MSLSFSYESTSSDDSSSESSDEGSDSSEYHEAREKLPESTAQHQQTAHNKAFQPQESTTVPQQTAFKLPLVIPDSESSSQTASVDTRLSCKATPSPATDTVVKTCASDHTSTPPPPANDPASKETVHKSPEKHTVTQDVTPTSSSTESTPEQNCCKTTEINKQQHSVQPETSVTPTQTESKAAPETDSATASAKQVR